MDEEEWEVTCQLCKVLKVCFVLPSHVSFCLICIYSDF
jgi:hypothetical protein